MLFGNPFFLKKQLVVHTIVCYIAPLFTDELVVLLSVAIGNRLQYSDVGAFRAIKQKWISKSYFHLEVTQTMFTVKSLISTICTKGKHIRSESMLCFPTGSNHITGGRWITFALPNTGVFGVERAELARISCLAEYELV